MTRLVIKTLISTLAIYITAYFSNQISYTNVYYPILAGLTIAVLGMIIEAAILGPKKIWINTIIDIIGAFTVMMFVFPLLNGVKVSAFGALIVAVIIGVVEYFSHQQMVSEDNQ